MLDLLFCWVTPLVRRGAADPLSYEDLLPPPHNATPKASTSALWQHWTQVSRYCVPRGNLDGIMYAHPINK